MHHSGDAGGHEDQAERDKHHKEENAKKEKKTKKTGPTAETEKPLTRTEKRAAKRARRKAAHGPRVIVMFTDREMPCGQAAREQLQAYAARVNATLRVTTKRHDAVFSKLPGGKLGPGETNTRFAKLWLAGEALREGASLVALFDDTVLVNGRTMDLFALAEDANPNRVVGQLEDHYLSQSLCDAYDVTGTQHGSCNTSKPMVNSGLVVFSQRHLLLFDDPLMGSQFEHREKVATTELRQTASLWEPGDKECFEIGGAHFCDQALLNALLQRHATPVLDLNRNSPGCSHLGEGKALDASQRDTLLGRATCRVAVGSVLQRLYNKKENMNTQKGNLDLKNAAQGLCFAHVTRGADDTRDKLLCDLGEMLRCEAA